MMRNRSIAQLACDFALNAFLVLGVLCCEATAADPVPPGRVLFIGIDGCRFDALEKARTPNLDKLLAAGCYSDQTQILGTRYRQSDTVSGPGWSSLLTGVWADKHGVDSNKFENPQYEKFPHFFARVKQKYPRAVTISAAAWPPISQWITTAADVNASTGEQEDYRPGDYETARLTADMLQRGNPLAMFAYFGQVDVNGHNHGFSPDVPQYIAAIERVDILIGRVLDALERRPNYAAENWLVLVSSDHGGFGKGHGNGHSIPEILHSFTIVSGAAARRGKLNQPTYLVDVPVTALTHLGVELDPKWGLDGKPVGLRTRGAE